MDFAAEFGLVAIIGALVGIGELVSRYRDAPSRVLLSLPGLIYILLNAAVADIALALGGPAVSGQSPVARVLLAGFGAMALLRSALFVVRSGDQDIGVGPSGFLQIVLSATDRAVDRRRAQARAAIVAEIMTGLSFTRSYDSLPTYCLALMQNLPAEDPDRFGRQIAKLQADPMADQAKVRALGLAIMNVVGEDVLKAAVKSLGDDLRDSPGT